MCTNYSHTKSKWLAQVDKGVSIGDLGREGFEKRAEILIDVIDALLHEHLGFCEEELLWGEFGKLSGLEPIFAHPVFHLALEHLMES